MAAVADFGAGIMEEQGVLLELASLMEQGYGLRCAIGRLRQMDYRAAPARYQFAACATSAWLEQYQHSFDRARLRITTYARLSGKQDKLCEVPEHSLWCDESLHYDREIADLVIAAGGYPL